MAKNNTVAIRFTGDVSDLKKATADAERELGGFGSRVGPGLKTAMLGAGAAAGAVLVDSFFAGMEREDTEARYAASLGLTDAQAKNFGKVAGGLYTQGFGESFDEVAAAVETVSTTLEEELDGEQIQPLTEKALNLADVFGIDVASVVSTVGYMLKNDLVRDAEEGFDTITVALQKIPTAMREEALEAISEYGTSFGTLGMDAEEALALILTAGQNTSVGIDKVGDAVKEFLVRSVDGSTATTEALTALELDAEEVATAIASGGPAAEEAFAKVVEALLTVEDPAERARSAVALFGEPVNDLNITTLPQFLEALQGAEGGLGDVDGAADELGDTMDTNARKLEAQKRKVDDLKNALVYDGLLGAFELVTEGIITFEEQGLAALDRFVDGGKIKLGDFTDALGGPVRGMTDLLGLVGVDMPEITLPQIGSKSEYTLEAPSRPAPSNPTPVGTGGSSGGGSRFQPRALGGDAWAGEGYLVGERGPELFRPDVDGQVVPNNRMAGANITINNHFTHAERAEDVTLRSLRKARLALS